MHNNMTDSIKKYLGNSYFTYNGNDLYNKPCLIAMKPGIGLIVFIVKHWYENEVIDLNNDVFYIKQDNVIERIHLSDETHSLQFKISNHIKAALGRHPAITTFVCLANISRAFIDTKFSDNTKGYYVLTKEDLSDHDQFLNKIESMAIVPGHSIYEPLTPLIINQVKCLFNDSPDKLDSQHVIHCYSIFAYIPDTLSDWKAVLSQLVDSYFNGSKIFLCTESHDVLSYAAEMIAAGIKARGLRFRHDGNLEIGPGESSLKLGNSDFSVFNFQTHLVNKAALNNSIPFFSIKDGLTDGMQERWLEEIQMCSSFNLQQYKIEHAAPRKNMLVKAGAGTGKTYIMISRIMYLCYIENIAPGSLKERIAMITFTNEAANNMKVRLKLCFENYYLLTGLNDFPKMMYHVEHMQISTIHSYALELIKKLGTADGFGQDLKITSGLYTRKKTLEEACERYLLEKIQEKPGYIESLGLPIYELRQILLDFISKLENKSIDATVLSKEDFGECADNPLLHEFIIHAIRETEQSFLEQLAKNNMIFLGRVIVTLKNLVEKYAEKLVSLSKSSRYMFIDEFQDTDDIQIEVLQKICNQAGYNMFIVGDIKQCIYRFRGAEEKAFDHLKNTDDLQTWHPAFSLNRNYRTDSYLLQLYQRLFESWRSIDEGLLVYNPREDSLVSNLELNSPEQKKTCFRKIIANSEGDRLPLLFDEVRSRIKEINAMIQSGKILSEKERTIAILVRDNWQADEIVRQGNASDLPLIESHSVGSLFQSMPALDLSALLHGILHNDVKHLSHLLESSFFKLSINRKRLYDLKPAPWESDQSRNKQYDYLVDILNKELSATSNAGCYEKWSDVLKAVQLSPVLQVLRALYKQLKPWQKYGGSESNAVSYYRMNVDLLFEIMLKECGIDNLALKQLSEYIDMCIMSGRQEKSRWPETGDKGIRLLCTTVHKAKGLEYGYVILPYTSFSIDKLKNNQADVVTYADGSIGYSFSYGTGQILRNNLYNAALESSERMKEETRILYVAMTRAIRAFSWIELNSANGYSWQYLLSGGIR